MSAREDFERGFANHMETWGPYCGAPKSVYRGHLEVLLKAQCEMWEEERRSTLDCLKDRIQRDRGQLEAQAAALGHWRKCADTDAGMIARLTREIQVLAARLRELGDPMGVPYGE